MNEIILIESVYQLIGFFVSILTVFSIFYCGVDTIIHFLNLREIKRVYKLIFDKQIELFKI